MRERKLVTDFGAYSTPREFLVICILPTTNSPRLWDYLVHASSYRLISDGSILHLLQLHSVYYLPFRFFDPNSSVRRLPSSPISSGPSPTLGVDSVLYLFDTHWSTTAFACDFNQYIFEGSRGYTEFNESDGVTGG
jgi:hypothetical protein